MSPTTFSPKRTTPLLPGTLKNLFYPPEKSEYEYFQRAKQNPFIGANGGDDPESMIVKAAWAADASMLCYARYGQQRMSDDDLQENLSRGGLKLRDKIGEDPADWNGPGTQAFLANGDGFAILAFRGTEADDPADAHSDLDILLVHEPEFNGAATPPLGHFSLLEHLLQPCLVHRGFQSALNSVWDHVHAALSAFRAEQPAAEICITGHSLGAALAVLTYSRFADSNMSAYTIGCPRVGNAAFRKRVAAGAGKGHMRVVNFDDLVAHVPLESLLYLHAPMGCYRFDDSGVLNLTEEDTVGADLSVLGGTFEGLPADFKLDMQLLTQRPAPPGLVDHSPARYCMRLWDCV